MVQNQITLGSPGYRHAHNLFLKKLKQLSEIATKMIIPMNVVFIPHPAQVSRYYQRNHLQLGLKLENRWVEKSNYPFFVVTQRKMGGQANLQFLNPLSHFVRKEQKSFHLYLLNDPHLNDSGQKELAMFLAKYIK